MRKLLSANYSRLWRDKIFWICMGTMLVYSVVYMLNGCRQGTVDLTELINITSILRCQSAFFAQYSAVCFSVRNTAMEQSGIRSLWGIQK